MSQYTDPICGMSVAPATAAGNFERDGEVFFFCSKNCLETFTQQIAGEKPKQKTVQTDMEKIPESEMKPDLAENTSKNPSLPRIQLGRKKPKDEDFVTE